jgi:hypothetical protein
MDPRIESRRVPRAVHKVALSILDNIDNRMIKTWLPRDAEGKIFEDQTLDNIDFSKRRMDDYCKNKSNVKSN